jgi:hypothetical protein
MARYLPGGVPTSGDIADLQRWLRQELEIIRSSTDDIYTFAEFAMDAFAAAGYGSISQSTGVNPLPDMLAGTWQDFTGFDVGSLAPRGVEYDLPNDAMAIDQYGVWYLSIAIVLEHNESNQGRELGLRLDNRTTNTPSAEVLHIGVGRNQPTTNITVVSLVEVTEGGVQVGVNNIAATSDAIGFEIGALTGDFSALNALSAYYQLHRVSEYRGSFSVGEFEGRRSTG